METSNQAKVQVGFWTNHAYGSTQGATLTLTSYNGAYLIAFLAVFVQLCGSCFWAILCYCLFILRSKSTGDGLHHQQQAIFRNTSSSEAAISRFLLAGLAWRKVPSTRRPMWRSIRFAVLALVNLLMFLIAGVFSSRVTRATSEVLVQPSLCGDFEYFGNLEYSKNTSEPERKAYDALTTEQVDWLSYAWEQYSSRGIEPSAIYTTSCADSHDKTGLCTPIVRQAINFTQTTSSECPFEDSMCVSNTLKLDTGMLDSLMDFGINTKLDDRVAYRRTAECAVITREGFSTPWLPYNNSLIQWAKHKYGYAIYPGDKGAFYYYGQDAYTLSNFTMCFWKIPYQPDTTLSGKSEFTVPGVFWMPHQPDSDNQLFHPIPQLLKNSIDLTLLWAFNSGIYPEPVNDPWLAAHELIHVNNSPIPGVRDGVSYMQGAPPRVLACAERSQFCSVETGACSNYTGGFHDFGFLNKHQQSIARRISYRPGIYPMAIGLSQYGLLADNYCNGGSCSKLPDDQWQKEAARYYGTSLVLSQYYSTSFVTGPTDQYYNKYWAPPPKTDEWMCHNQIAVRNDYASFSVLGLGLILGLGGLIILVYALLETIVDHWKPAQGTAWQEWQLTSFVQLQRIAFESRGEGTWTGKDSSHPVTETETFLARLQDAPSNDNNDRSLLAKSSSADDLA